jgi:hypothetical protein
VEDRREFPHSYECACVLLAGLPHLQHQPGRRFQTILDADQENDGLFAIDE